MNKPNFLKKYWLFIVLTFIAAVGAYFYFFAPPVVIPPVTVPTITPIPTTPVTSLPPVQTGFAPVGQIIWRLDSLPIPETLPVIHIAAPSNNPASYTPLANALGINAAPEKIPNYPIINWVGPESSFYVNLQDKIASFSLNTDAGSLPTTGEKIDPETLTANLISLLSSGLALPPDFSLAAGDTKLLSVEEERFVPASAAQATFAEISLNYAFRNFVVTYRGLPAVTARYSLYGPLASLKISLPFSQTSLSPEYTLKTFAEVKATPADQFEVISQSGNRAFELSDKEEILKSVVVTGGYVGYLINPNSSAVAPYVFLTGTSTTSKYGQINVTLATPALKLQQETE